MATLTPHRSAPLSFLQLQESWCTFDHAKVLMQAAAAPVTRDLEREIADLMVQALNLTIAAADIDPAAPLYREGLGLDSIDILEIALVVAKRYGVEIKADSENNHQIFGSLTALAEFVAARRTK
ncbi:MAG TPA: phosphopantetheine-binding protein [Steroidobacteraceae bacterium]|nr:phosphopantetheine-binding protein [Steroidobacteraceae bacterium]